MNFLKTFALALLALAAAGAHAQNPSRFFTQNVTGFVGDNATFFQGTSPINVTGGFYSLSATNCNSGSACAPQLTIDRKLFVQAFQSTGTNFHIVCDSGCGGASSFGDNAAFTAGTTPINVVGGWYSSSATNCTSGDACAPQLTIDRKLFVQAFQGTSPWADNVTQFGGTNVSTGTGVGGAGIPRVTVSSDSFPSSQAVTGTFYQTTQPVSIASMPSTPVTGTFWQATQPVSGTVATTPPANASTNITQFNGSTLTGTVTAYGTAPTGNVFGVNASVTNFPGSQAVTGTFWQTTQPVSGTFWQATQPVSIASMPSTPVTGTFWQTTQPVSGTVSSTQGTSPWVDNVTQFGGTNLSTGTGVGGAGIPRVTVSSDSFPSSQAVSGTVTSNAGTGTFSVAGTVADGSTTEAPIVVVGGETNDATSQYQPIPLGTGGRSLIVEGVAGGTPQPVQVSSSLPMAPGVIPVIVLASAPPVPNTTNPLLYRAALKTYCYQNLAGCGPTIGGGTLK